MRKPWKKVSSSYAHQNPWYSVSEDNVIRPDGKPGKYFVVHNRPGTAIIAKDADGKFILIQQYRYPVKRDSIHTINGTSDKGQTPLQNVKEELREEVGLEAAKWKFLGKIFASPGHSDESIYVYLAEDLKKVRSLRPGEEKDIVTVEKSLLEIDQMIKKGIIFDSFAISAFHLYKLYN